MCCYAFTHSPLSLKRSDMLALPGSPSAASTVLLLWQAFTTCSVTKATPIQFIDGRSHMKKWRCHKTALSGCYTCFSRDLLLMPSGADTHIHQRSWTKRFQETRCAWPLAARPWFKKKKSGLCEVILGNQGYILDFVAFILWKVIVDIKT